VAVGIVGVVAGIVGAVAGIVGVVAGTGVEQIVGVVVADIVVEQIVVVVVQVVGVTQLQTPGCTGTEDDAGDCTNRHLPVVGGQPRLRQQGPK